MTEVKQTEQKIEEQGDLTKSMGFAEFLEAVPPSQTILVHDLFGSKRNHMGGRETHLQTPQLQLHCPHSECGGPRFFRFSQGNTELYGGRTALNAYLTYLCSNCATEAKHYSVRAMISQDGVTGQVYKYGEEPPYGPPTPARLIRLFEGERETFLKGRQCENHGLGVGAFVYYRRVVERQKNRILDEIIKVSEKIGAPAETIATLQSAKTEIQFSKALASVKDAIPQALLINGHNPLTLLHRALSAGLHDQTDEECLSLAHDVRVVLVELAERLGQALKDEAEISNAINRLINSPQKK